MSRNEWKYDVELLTNFDPSLPPVSCFPSELNRVSLNKIVNAAHTIKVVNGDGSTDKDTTIIWTQRDGDHAEIRICDTGTGIPEEIHNRNFDPLVTTKEVGKGIGQGLAIAHSVIAENHAGTLEVQSEIGKGASFVIRLPLNQTSDEIDTQLDSETHDELPTVCW